MLKYIAVGAVVLVAAVLIAATFQPDSFRVTRSARIKAAPEKIFAYIDNFHQWRAWSPWERMDPELKRTYSGAESGIGAAYAWESNKVGSGRMEILNASNPQKIDIQLDFVKPIEAHNSAVFTLQVDGGETLVTWEMSGRNTYIPKLMSLFFSMDKMVGKDFESGLANLKSLAEANSA